MLSGSPFRLGAGALAVSDGEPLAAPVLDRRRDRCSSRGRSLVAPLGALRRNGDGNTSSRGIRRRAGVLLALGPVDRARARAVARHAHRDRRSRCAWPLAVVGAVVERAERADRLTMTVDDRRRRGRGDRRRRASVPPGVEVLDVVLAFVLHRGGHPGRRRTRQRRRARHRDRRARRRPACSRSPPSADRTTSRPSRSACSPAASPSSRSTCGRRRSSWAAPDASRSDTRSRSACSRSTSCRAPPRELVDAADAGRGAARRRGDRGRGPAPPPPPARRAPPTTSCTGSPRSAGHRAKRSSCSCSRRSCCRSIAVFTGRAVMPLWLGGGLAAFVVLVLVVEAARGTARTRACAGFTPPGQARDRSDHRRA